MSKDEVELDFKFDIDKVLKHAKEVGFEIVEKTEENEQGGLFYKDENGELVKWDIMKELFPYREMTISDEGIDRIEERLIEAKRPVGKQFEHKNKKSIYLELEEVNEELGNMSEEEITKLNEKIKKDIQLEETHLRIKDEIQNMMIEEIEGINKTIESKSNNLNKNNFCVLEISKDDLGHEYEVVYEVVNGLENAISLCNRLNKNNNDTNTYFEIEGVNLNKEQKQFLDIMEGFGYEYDHDNQSKGIAVYYDGERQRTVSIEDILKR